MDKLNQLLTDEEYFSDEYSDKFFSEESRRWEDKYPYRHPPLTKLLDIFPETFKTARIKLREFNDQKITTEKECKDRRGRMMLDAKTNDAEQLKFIHWMAFSPLEKIKEQIKHWEKIINIQEWRRKPANDNTVTEQDILRAKECPLLNFTEKPNHAGFVLCPFHNDKHPSCKIYPDNRFHCFSCTANGDVIDLVSKTHGLDFINAVKKIINK